MDEHTRDPGVAPPLGDPTGWREDRRWEHATLRRAAEHGVRLYNAGAHTESYDCFKFEWYNYGRGTAESAFCHGMQQVAAGTHKHAAEAGRGAEAGDDGMRSLFSTALDYLRGVPADFYGVDVAAVRRRLLVAIFEPRLIDGWRIAIDGHTPDAYPADYEYAAGLG